MRLRSTRAAPSSRWPQRQSHEGLQGQGKAGDHSGRPVWTVRLVATDTRRETKETIWVEVAGDEPKLTFDGYAQVHSLVYAPWVGKDGKLRRASRPTRSNPQARQAPSTPPDPPPPSTKPTPCPQQNKENP